MIRAFMPCIFVPNSISLTLIVISLPWKGRKSENYLRKQSKMEL